MSTEKVTLYDVNGDLVDVVDYPVNKFLEPGAMLNYQGRKFVRGGGPANLYGANEYGETMEESSK